MAGPEVPFPLGHCQGHHWNELERVSLFRRAQRQYTEAHKVSMSMSDIVRVQTIHNQQSKELLHHEMSLVEREPHVNDGIRRQGRNSRAALTARKRSCLLPSRATEGSTASNTKSASEASVFNRISCNETAAAS